VNVDAQISAGRRHDADGRPGNGDLESITVGAGINDGIIDTQRTVNRVRTDIDVSRVVVPESVLKIVRPIVAASLAVITVDE
jgi:hypothetical protein